MRLAVSATIGTEPCVWHLDAPSIRIGRDESNSVQLRCKGVSRRHAEIVLRGGRMLLRDLHSRNGTSLNGKPIHRAAELHAGDHIRVGPVSLSVADDAPEPPIQFADPTDSTVLVEFTPEPRWRDEGRAGAGSRELVQQLAAFGRILEGHRSLPGIYDALLAAVAGAMPATRLQLLLREDSGEKLAIVASRPRLPCFADSPVISPEALRRVLEGGKGVIVPAPRQRPMTDPLRDGTQEIATAMAVPLVQGKHALGVIYAENSALDRCYGPEHLDILTLFANMAAIRIANVRRSDEWDHLAALEQELVMAARIQRWLLPPTDVRISAYEVQTALEPCEAIGGDFFDIQSDARGRVWLMLGDVSGKGICGALLMSTVISAARVLYDECDDPIALARRLNGVLRGHSGTERFVTAFLARLDPDTGRLDYVNAGHPSAILFHDERMRTLESTGFPLGIFPTVEYPPASVVVEPGEFLALFSDGVPEARRPSGRLFGAGRLAAAIGDAARCQSLGEASRVIIHHVDEFLAGRPRTDDIALLLLRRAAGPRGRSPEGVAE